MTIEVQLPYFSSGRGVGLGSKTGALTYGSLIDSRTTPGYPEAAMALKASSLRENIYRILDQVLETGIPVEIERRGKILKNVPAEAPGKLANLKPPPELRSAPQEVGQPAWAVGWRT